MDGNEQLVGAQSGPAVIEHVDAPVGPPPVDAAAGGPESWPGPDGVDDIPAGAGLDERIAGAMGVEVDRFRVWCRRSLSFVVLASCCAYVFWLCHPELMLSNSTPTGGDMGAHLWGPAYLRDELLPHLRLTGWTPDWYAGFPAYSFYMVIPSLAIVALSVGVLPWWSFPIVAVAFGWLAWLAHIRITNRLVRFAAFTACVIVPVLLVGVPYNVAFKIVASSGVILFPVGVWYLGKGLNLRQPVPELMAVISLFYLVDNTLFSIYGGNIASTMAGEFCFSISLTLSMFYLGTVAKGLSTGRHRARAAALLGLVALCHVIPFIFAVAATGVLLVLRPRVRSLKWLVPVGATGACIAAFWYIPFYGRSSFLDDMGWEKLGRTKDAVTGKFLNHWSEYMQYLWPIAPHNDTTGKLRSDNASLPNMLHGRVFFVLAGIGLILSLVLAIRAGVFLGLLAAVSVVAFRLMPQQRFWNARILPFYYLTIYLLAAVGVWLIVRSVFLVIAGRWSHPPFPLAAGGALVGLLVTLIAIGMTLQDLPGGTKETTKSGVTYNWMGLSSTYVGAVRGWTAWNYSGLEGKGAAYSEFHAMIQTMAQVGKTQGCGRAMWEFSSDLNKYGTTMAPMLLPYYTHSCIGSMEGLYFEASSTTPFHFLNQSELSTAPSDAQRWDQLGFTTSPYESFNLAKGIQHLQLLGVRYYMAYSSSAKAAAASEASSPGHQLTKVAESGPWVVYRVADTPLVAGLDHLPNVWTNVSDDIHSWALPAVSWYQDPSKWDIYRAADGPRSWPRITSSQQPKSVPTPVAKVTHIVENRESMSFDVDRVGTPVVVRESYFPNWEASGAEGPYRVAPNLMVVIPTSHHVELTYGRTAMEYLAWLITFVGLGGFLYFVRTGTPEPFVAGEWVGDRDYRTPAGGDGPADDPVDGPDAGAGDVPRSDAEEEPLEPEPGSVPLADRSDADELLVSGVGADPDPAAPPLPPPPP